MPCDVYQPRRALRNRQGRGESELLASWLDQLPRPVGLVCCNDERARVAAQACATAGLSVPEEVGIIGVDNDDVLCELSDPPISSVALDLDAAGYAAAELLAGLMSGTVQGPQESLVQPQWVVARRSTDIEIQQDDAVATALRFIRDSAFTPIQVTDVVRQTSLSRRTLERRFFDALGRTMLDEITRRRVERAKRLLLQTDLPIARIAAVCGFVNPRPLARALLVTEGCSPAEYRRSQGLRRSADSAVPSPEARAAQ